MNDKKVVMVSDMIFERTAEPAYYRLQGNKEFCLLEKKSIIKGVE